MAQIIKHRRGSLEALSAVTSSLQKGEIVIASGSSNLTTTNGSSIVFAANENGQVQAVNRFLMGDNAPNTFAGSTYNGMVKGVPYYASGSSTLYLLGTDGNEAINLVGNIQPFSASVASSINALSASIGSGTIGNSVNSLNAYTASNNASQSVQDARISSLEAFSGSQLGKDATLATYTASVDSHISAINAFSASQLGKDSTLATYTASIDAHVSAVNAFSASQLGKDSTLATYTASVDAHIAAINTFSASQEGKDSALATYTGSVNSKFSAIATYTGSVNSQLTELYASASNHEGRVDKLEASQSAFDTAIALDGTNVTINGNFKVTGTQTIVDSTTVQIGDNIIELNGSGAANGGLWVKDATAPNTATGSIVWDSTNDYWKAGVKGAESKVLVAGGDSVVSGSSQITISSTTGYTAFSSSLAAKDAELFASASDHESRIDTIEASVGGAAGIGSRVSALEAYSSSNDTTNAAQNARLSALETETGSIATAQSAQNARLSALETETGSIASAQSVQNGRLSSIEGFTSSINTTIKSKLNADGVISGSSQVTLSSVTGFTSYSTSVDSRLDSVEAAIGNGSNIDTRLSSLESFSGSQESKNSTLASYTSSVDSKFSTLASYTGSVNDKFAAVQSSTSSLNAFTASQDSKNSALATYTGSVNTKFAAVQASTSSLNSFTASADSRLTTLEGTGNIQGVGTSNEVTFAKVTTSGDVIIGGDLVVQGNTTTLNTAQLVVEDKLITLASGSTSNATANGAGFEIAGTSASFKYDGTNNQFSSSIDIVADVTGSLNVPGFGTSKRAAFRNAAGNIDFVAAPTTAGDLLQWDGSDFVMSNTIDGGSF